MLRATYTDEEQNTFDTLRYTYPDARIMWRFEILWLHVNVKFVPEKKQLLTWNSIKPF
jgi:hypothetical protein